MRNPLVQFAAVILAAFGITAGVFLGLSQISTEVTPVGPATAKVRASCGLYYVPSIPARSNADPVPLPTDPKVLVPRPSYVAQCEQATSWQPYLAWGITGLGLLGLVVIFVARRQRLAEDSEKRSGPSAGSPQSSPLWH